MAKVWYHAILRCTRGILYHICRSKQIGEAIREAGQDGAVPHVGGRSLEEMWEAGLGGAPPPHPSRSQEVLRAERHAGDGTLLVYRELVPDGDPEAQCDKCRRWLGAFFVAINADGSYASVCGQCHKHLLRCRRCAMAKMDGESGEPMCGKCRQETR